MNPDLINAYCSELLGEKTTDSPKFKSKKDKVNIKSSSKVKNDVEPNFDISNTGEKKLKLKALNDEYEESSKKSCNFIASNIDNINKSSDVNITENVKNIKNLKKSKSKASNFVNNDFELGAINNSNVPYKDESTERSKLKNTKGKEDTFKNTSEIPADDFDDEESFGMHSKRKTKDSPKLKNKEVESKNNSVTEDGFKIISEIPPDDSDVSDAFEIDDELSQPLSDDETETVKQLYSDKLSKKMGHITDDGFKLVSNIPSDDSDVSDAFESDYEDPETDIKSLATYNLSGLNRNSEETNRMVNIKKPLRKLIEDFGMQDKFFNKKNQNVQREKKTQENIMIIDYSKQRGNKKKDKPQKIEQTSSTDSVTKKDTEMELKKARYEVFKLGMNASSGKEKIDKKIEMAVRLGAKPPRKEYKNYKKLIEERKLLKEHQKRKREEDREMGLPVKKSNSHKPNKNKPADMVDVNPKIGKFKNGVLSLSKSDIERMKR